MKAYYYFYLTEDDHVIRIWAKKRPSEATRRRAVTWVVKEYSGEDGWFMPAFPEIGWVTLRSLRYIGKVDAVTTSRPMPCLLS